MKKCILIILCFVSLVSAKADDDKIAIVDVFSGEKLYYTKNWTKLKDNPFNKFENITYNYLEFLPNQKDLNSKALNSYLATKVANDLNNHIFKSKFTQFAQNRLYLYLTPPKVNQWFINQNRHQIKLVQPILINIECNILFKCNNVISLQFGYSFYFKDYKPREEEAFFYLNTVYVNLQTGKEVFINDFFKTELKEKLIEIINSKADSTYQVNYKKINDYTWLKPETNWDELQEVNEEEDDVSASPLLPIPKFYTKFRISSLKNLNFMVTPINAYFFIETFLPETKEFNNIGIAVSIPLNYFLNFVDPKSALGILKIPEIGNTNLTNVNTYRDIYFNPLDYPKIEDFFNPFIDTIPFKIKYKDIYQQQIYNGDTASFLYKRFAFNKNGRLTKTNYGNENDNITNYIYDKQQRLIKIVNISSSIVENFVEFSYDKNNNVIQSKLGNLNDTSILNYVFIADKMYLFLKFDLLYNTSYKFQNFIEVYNLNQFGKVINFTPIGVEPSYKNVFENKKLMASFSFKYVNLDNHIYCYNTKGNILSVMYDNGRHLSMFTYNEKNKLIEFSNFDGTQLKTLNNYSYFKNGLIEDLISLSDNYGYENNSKTTKYLFKYTYY